MWNPEISERTPGPIANNSRTFLFECLSNVVSCRRDVVGLKFEAQDHILEQPKSAFARQDSLFPSDRLMTRRCLHTNNLHHESAVTSYIALVDTEAPYCVFHRMLRPRPQRVLRSARHVAGKRNRSRDTLSLAKDSYTCTA